MQVQTELEQIKLRFGMHICVPEQAPPCDNRVWQPAESL